MISTGSGMEEVAQRVFLAKQAEGRMKRTVEEVHRIAERLMVECGKTPEEAFDLAVRLMEMRYEPTEKL